MEKFAKTIGLILILGVVAAVIYPAFNPAKGGSVKRPPPPYVRLCKEAQALAKRGLTDQALAKYEQALALRPQNTDLRRRLVYQYENCRNTEKVKTHLAYLIQSTGTTEDETSEIIVTILEQAKKHRVAENTAPMVDRALNRLKPPRIQEPGFPKVVWTAVPASKLSALYTAAALQSLTTTNYHQALIRLRQAIEIEPNNKPARVYAAYAAAKANKTNQEIARCLKGVDPKHPDFQPAIALIREAQNINLQAKR